MLTKFNPGDRVRFTIADQAGEWPKEGVVRSVHAEDSDRPFYDVRLDTGFIEKNVPQVSMKPAAKFKPGDRVTIFHPQFPGHTGVLAAFVTRWDDVRMWTVDLPKGKSIVVPEGDMEPEPPKARRADSFQAGERVQWKYHPDDATAMTGTVGPMTESGFVCVRIDDGERRYFDPGGNALSPAPPKAEKPKWVGVRFGDMLEKDADERVVLYFKNGVLSGYVRQDRSSSDGKSFADFARVQPIHRIAVAIRTIIDDEASEDLPEPPQDED
jgi:hypothetical protein